MREKISTFIVNIFIATMKFPNSLRKQKQKAVYRKTWREEFKKKQEKQKVKKNISRQTVMATTTLTEKSVNFIETRKKKEKRKINEIKFV